MVLLRIGSVAGHDEQGSLRVVSLYRDKAGYKLCGPSGSRIVNGSLDTAIAVAADEFVLTKAEYLPSQRAA